jgi:hypothetical protein
MNLKEVGSRIAINYQTGKPEKIKSIRPEDVELERDYATRTTGFALRMLDEKTNGTFLEIGSSHWREGNHTYFLEKEFGWRGVGIDIEDHFAQEYNKNRESECISADALSFNWDEYLEQNNFPKTIDFLQIDVDDIIPHSNLLALLNLPLSRYRFNTMSIEHLGHFDKRYEQDRDIQRNVLYSYGYILVASMFTEDWWIDSRLELSPNTYDQLTAASWLRRLF